MDFLKSHIKLCLKTLYTKRHRENQGWSFADEDVKLLNKDAHFSVSVSTVDARSTVSGQQSARLMCLDKTTKYSRIFCACVNHILASWNSTESEPDTSERQSWQCFQLHQTINFCVRPTFLQRTQLVLGTLNEIVVPHSALELKISKAQWLESWTTQLCNF